MNTPLWIRVGTILFVSGFCSLVYQVAWLRLLRLIFGVSTASQATVVAIFMGGLGLGGYLFGRRLRRVRNPLLLYAALELGIALAAALSPLLVAAARHLYLALGGAGALGLPLATLLRLLLSVLVLGLPTTLMGGTLPAISQAVERRSDLGRRDVAWLYGINTLGAVSGAFLATFLLLEIFGIRQSLWLACLLNLLLAVAARALARRPPFADSPTADAPTADARTADARTADEAIAADRPPSPEEPGVQVPSRLPLEAKPVGVSGDRRENGARVVLPIAAAVGFLFFLMEIVWYRMLAPLLGGSSYTFGLILCVALLGIGLGGLLYARGRRRRRPTFLALATTCALEALFLILPLAAGDDLAWLAAALRSLAAVGFSGLVAGWTVIAGLTVLPAAVVAGYQFPLLVALLGSGRRRVGYEVGLAYAWNTWGAILGSLAGGFGLLPLLTAPRLWRLAATLLVAVAAVAAAADFARRRQPRRLLAPLALGALALGLCLAPGPSAFWRHSPTGAGRNPVDFVEPNRLEGHRRDVRRALVREAEGVESSVALLAYEDLSLVVNGKSDGSARGDAPTQVMGGLVGALLHPEPRQALVIGLGTGTTAGWLAAVPSISRVEVVELEPAVYEYAEAFRAVNGELLTSPKVRSLRGDGREYVLTTARSYDIIFSEPSNPFRAGVADLFSRDFYRAALDRLTADGIFLQWLQGYEIDAGVLETVYATLASVFPHVETWQIHHNDLLLVAAGGPIVHDFDRVRRRVASEPYAGALRQVWRVEGAEGFYSGFVAGGELAAAFADLGEAWVSSDDRPRVEFGFARNMGRTDLLRLTHLHILARRLGTARPQSSGGPAGGPLDWQRVEDYRQLRTALETLVFVASEEPSPERWRRYEARRAYGQGNLRRAGESWRRQSAAPAGHLDLLLVAEALAEVGAEDGEKIIARLEPTAATEAEALRARLAWRRGEAEAALGHLVATFRRCRGDGWFFRPMIRRLLRLAEELVEAHPEAAEPLLEVLAEPFAVHQLEDSRRRLRVAAAAVLERRERCARAFLAFEPHVPWEERFLAARAACYRDAGHPRAAAAEGDLEDFRAAAPPKLGIPEAEALPEPPAAGDAADDGEKSEDGRKRSTTNR